MEDLNTSDHLPLTVSFYYSAYSGSQNEGMGRQLRIDWDEARRSGALDMFASKVQVRLAPLLVGVYDDSGQMSREIELVAGLLTDAAEKLLPHVQPRRRARWRDDTLSCLCAQSRAARAAWKEAGRPGEGPLFDEKSRLRRAVRKRVRFCAARSERMRMQRRERGCLQLGIVGDSELHSGRNQDVLSWPWVERWCRTQRFFFRCGWNIFRN